MTRHGEISVGGVRSPVFEAGPEAPEEAVVFVHGNPGSIHDWERLAEATGRHGRAIALDMPGFGDADKPKDFPYTIEGYAAHLGGALEQLGVERAHIVVHDFGGPWGLRWAVDNPDAYASTTLVDTGILYGYSWHALAKIWRLRGVGELFFKLTTRSAAALGAETRPAAAAARRSLRALLQGEQGQGHAAGDPPPLPLQPAERARTARRSAAGARTGRRWSSGARTTPTSRSSTPSSRSRPFPDAEVVVLEESGHWPMWDAPEEMEAAIVPFLARQLAL